MNFAFIKIADFVVFPNWDGSTSMYVCVPDTISEKCY